MNENELSGGNIPAPHNDNGVPGGSSSVPHSENDLPCGNLRGPRSDYDLPGGCCRDRHSHYGALDRTVREPHSENCAPNRSRQRAKSDYDASGAAAATRICGEMEFAWCIGVRQRCPPPVRRLALSRSSASGSPFPGWLQQIIEIRWRELGFENLSQDVASVIRQGRF
jgi:hypothetical protein